MKVFIFLPKVLWGNFCVRKFLQSWHRNKHWTHLQKTISSQALWEVWCVFHVYFWSKGIPSFLGQLEIMLKTEQPKKFHSKFVWDYLPQTSAPTKLLKNLFAGKVLSWDFWLKLIKRRTDNVRINGTWSISPKQFENVLFLRVLSTKKIKGPLKRFQNRKF